MYFNNLSNWLHSQSTPCLELVTGLPAENIPAEQTEKVQNAQKKQKTWVKAYKHEEPLVLSSSDEQKQFQDNRTISSTCMAITASMYGLGSVLFNQRSISPTDEQLKKWIESSSIITLASRKGALLLSPYERMPTLQPDMKHFGTTLRFQIDDIDKNDRQLTVKGIELKVLYSSLEEKNTKKTTVINVSPTDAAWPSAKLMLMHNLNHQLVLHEHPSIHVLATTINHLTQKYIPDVNHPIRCLLEPHMAYTDVITDKVLNDSHSILMDHVSSFSPFDIDIATMHKFHIQSAHKRFGLYITPNLYENVHYSCAYTNMMSEYRHVIQTWVRQFLNLYFEWENDAHIKPVKTWWKGLCRHFGRHFAITQTGGSKQMLRPSFNYSNLLACLTTIIFSVSVVHSTDHYLYSQIPAVHKPWRWRGSVPQNKDDGSADPELTAWDVFQAQSTNHMFFGVNPAVLLCDVQYRNFPMNNVEFKSELDKISDKYKLISTDKIAASIDW